MKTFRADLHIHTLLSPCGSLDNTPTTIINRAKEKQLDIIGITDHNCGLQSFLVKELGEKAGIFVMMGMEITSKEEAHCLAFFEKKSVVNEFSNFIYDHILPIHNDPDRFGYQVVIDKDEDVINEIDKLLISATDLDIDRLEHEVHQRNGLFIPAHIERPRFSLTSQLGFVPPDMNVDGFEISRHTNLNEILTQYPYLKNYAFIQSSDAHYPEDIGKTYTEFEMEAASFDEIRLALKKENGRNVSPHRK